MKRRKEVHRHEYRLPEEFGACTVRKLRLKRGSVLGRGEAICDVMASKAGLSSMRTVKFNPVDLQQDGDALVIEICVEEGRSVAAGDILFIFGMCEHALFIRGLCSSCGLDVSRRNMNRGLAKNNSSTDLGKQHVQLLPSQPDFLFHYKKASEVDNRSRSRLMDSKKLSLVLDLDLTLLHATFDARHEDVLRKAPASDVRDVHTFQMAGFAYHVKLRPGLAEFLAHLNSKFELHIFTHGKNEYGNRIAELLDPTGEYFRAQEGIGERRVTTLDEAYGDHEVAVKLASNLAEYKKIERLFPVSDRMVLVLDDNFVWGPSPNVIRVMPYHFWNSHLPPERVGEFEVNGQAKEIPLSLLYFSEAASDSHLQDLQTLLDEIHSSFFADPSQHVASVFAASRKKVLSGCKLVFSGVFPHKTDKHSAVWWQLAREFGAECCDHLEDDGVTHVVATMDGTEKIKQAKSMGIFTVHLLWLADSIRRFRRLNESLYEKLPHQQRFEDRKLSVLSEELLLAYRNVPKEEQKRSQSNNNNNNSNVLDEDDNDLLRDMDLALGVEFEED